jgi:hypothetical protein
VAERRRDPLSPFGFTHEFVIAHLDDAGGRESESRTAALVAFQHHIRRLWSRHVRQQATTVPLRVCQCTVRA